MNNQPALSDQIIFPTVDAAVAAATGAQLLFRNQSLKVRRAVIKAIRAVSIVNSERWGRRASRGTLLSIYLLTLFKGSRLAASARKT